MITNNDIKYVRSLSLRKFRQKYNKFIAEGDKICSDLLLSHNYVIDTIYCTEEWAIEHDILLNSYEDALQIVSPKNLGRLSQLKTAHKVIVIAQLPDETISPEIIGRDTVLYLSEVQNPGNVGTIIRIADWYGIKYVIRSEGTSDFYSPKVIQSTMASFANVSLHTMEFEALKSKLTTHRSVGATLSGVDIQNYEWSDPSIIIMGNEGKGIPEDIINQLDDQVKISGNTDRLADSLNVGIATALICQSWFGR